jgi:hypothetical protein
MLSINNIGLSVLVSVGLMTASHAQDAPLNPRVACTELLLGSPDVDPSVLAGWIAGYVAARTGSVVTLDAAIETRLLDSLRGACLSTPELNMMELVDANTDAKAQQGPGDGRIFPGSETDARVLLSRFYAPDADHRALTQALIPTQEEIAMVYAQPLAFALFASYQAVFTPDVVFRPKENHNDFSIYYTTTADLVNDPEVQYEFPGGYADVLSYFKLNVPIVTFKFIKSGERRGWSFDGLIYVNDRWVLMPKPWRALP